MNFKIPPIENHILNESLTQKINQKTKPIGALGVLESIALQIGLIQNTLSPKLQLPSILVFAADHGIAKEGIISPYPQEVTAQMVYNFLNEGAAINVFCRQHAINLKIIDAGVNHQFEKSSSLIDAKIALGTQNYQEQPAMKPDQCKFAIQKGALLVEETHKSGSNCIGFGEMGIGNTSSASLLMAYFTKTPINECVGAGTGLEPDAIKTKIDILSNVFHKYTPNSTEEALATFGGFEIAMITGAILKAAELKMTIMIDGFIVTAALLAANAIHERVLDYCIFAHSSNEQGHEKMLTFLDRKPILNLNMRLGEGTGAAVAIPIVQSAVAFLSEMASFESASVSNKT